MSINTVLFTINNRSVLKVYNTTPNELRGFLKRYYAIIRGYPFTPEDKSSVDTPMELILLAKNYFKGPNRIKLTGIEVDTRPTFTTPMDYNLTPMDYNLKSKKDEVISLEVLITQEKLFPLEFDDVIVGCDGTKYSVKAKNSPNQTKKATPHIWLLSVINNKKRHMEGLNTAIYSKQYESFFRTNNDADWDTFTVEYQPLNQVDATPPIQATPF